MAEVTPADAITQVEGGADDVLDVLVDAQRALKMQEGAEIWNSNCVECEGSGDWAKCSICADAFGKAIDARNSVMPLIDTTLARHRTTSLAAQDEERKPSHYCVICAARWKQWPDKTWTLLSDDCGTCCNNAPMGYQILEYDEEGMIDGREADAAKRRYWKEFNAPRIPAPSLAAQDGLVDALEAAKKVILLFKDADTLGEGVHTGLRKGTDAFDSHRLWTAISNSQTTAWRDAVRYAIDPYFSMWGGKEALEKIDAALASIEVKS